MLKLVDFFTMPGFEPGHHKLKHATFDSTHAAVRGPSQTSTVPKLLSAHSDGVAL